MELVVTLVMAAAVAIPSVQSQVHLQREDTAAVQRHTHRAEIAADRLEELERIEEERRHQEWHRQQEAQRQAVQPPSRASVWHALAECESNGRWDYNGPSGYDGGLQFHPGTWNNYKPASFPAYAYQATPAQQMQVAELVLASEGWGAWPACSRKLGLR